MMGQIASSFLTNFSFWDVLWDKADTGNGTPEKYLKTIPHNNTSLDFVMTTAKITDPQSLSQLLESSDQPLVGILRIKGHIHASKKGKYRYLFQPYNHQLPPMLVYTSINRTRTPGDVLALVRFTEWTEGEQHPSGQLVRNLGSTLDHSKIIDSWLYHYGLEEHLKSPKIDFRPLTPEFRLTDHSDCQVFSIDPPGCVDVDDAFHYEAVPGAHRLYIHIACLGHQFSELLRLLNKRASSLYLPDQRQLDLLPQEWVTAASLLAGQRRTAVTLRLDLDSSGLLLDHEFYPSQIVNQRQLSYQQVDSYLHYEQPFWVNLRQVISSLRTRNSDIFSRSREGPIDSHSIIETMMVLYNHLGAKWLIKVGELPILRVHPPVEEKSDRSDTEVDQQLADFLRFLDYQSATYQSFHKGLTPEQRLHYGLGLIDYGHLTSPIRRLVDAFNQHLLIKSFDSKSTRSPIPDLELINAIESRQRKFYRRCQIYELYQKIGDKVIKCEVFPYQKEQEDVYRCYWPKHKLSLNLRLGVNQQTSLSLLEPVKVEVAVAFTPLPRLRTNLAPRV
jgi:exoribonuclease R